MANIPIPKLSKKEKLGLYLAFLFLAFAFLDRMIIDPVSSKLKSIDSEIENMEKKIKVNLGIIAEKEEISARLQKYQSLVEGKYLSDEEEMAFMLSELEIATGKAGTTLINIKPHAPIQIAFYKKYQADVEIIGNISNLLDFLHRIRASKQLLRIDKLNLAPYKEESGILKANILVARVIVS